MQLLDYINSLSTDQQEAFAEKCGTSMAYLRQVAYGNRVCREKLASKIEGASDGLVTRQELRPDDWQEIWPELVPKGGKK
ncbi:helix-turn-helix domain-containing protein [Cupriavidus taiwanensis]|uniref:transcriptional regulator n=1 Tax=Cupriavidus taiwanensis TaxID=164546 RepID=UPI0015744BD1|nr:YdaS family helix-turn-helix protein [Cupriavidus taiwanensis]NSX14992.1 helix-turn-helix domain-containing protein [Cupriavidus taiwanensis]